MYSRSATVHVFIPKCLGADVAVRCTKHQMVRANVDVQNYNHRDPQSYLVRCGNAPTSCFPMARYRIHGYRSNKLMFMRQHH